MRGKFSTLMQGTKKLLHALTPKTKTQWMTSVFVVIGMVVLSSFIALPVQAQGVVGEAVEFTTNMLLTMFAEIFLLLARICISMTVFALEFFIKLAKYNGFVDAPIVILGWTMVRDIANMFFVVVLLVIAFGTILGLEQYEWKKTMVNFILAAIFINFSKLIAGIIIDVSHVFTMTFVNAISATAGGNLINMFHLDKIMSIIGGGQQFQNELLLELFGGSVMALVFAVLAMFTMGAYMIILVMRLVVLWALIILSPLAYIMAVIPQTKSYADTWWSEFGKHVAVAPVMVFFLWLGFATLGSGNFAGPDLEMSFGTDQATAAAALGITAPGVNKVSISEVSTWENMANFILAIAFLWIGIEQVQKMGVRGGQFAQKAIDTAQTVAMVASGYAAGRWLLGKGKEYAYDKPIDLAKQGAAFGAGQLWNRTVGAPINEKISKHKAKYDAWTAQRREARAQYAKKIEGISLGHKIWARIVEPAERSNKRAKDWDRGAEFAQGRLEENLGTSGTEAGLFKQRQGERLRSQEEEVNAPKRVEKQEKMRRDAGEIYMEIAANVDSNAVKGKVESDMAKWISAKGEDKLTPDQIKKRRDFLTEKFQKEAEDKVIAQREKAGNGLTKEQRELFKLGRTLASDRRVSVGSMAKGEQMREENEDTKKIQAAEARDKLREADGEIPVFVAATNQEILERENKRLGALNFREATTAGVNYEKNLAATVKKFEDAIRDGKPTDALKDEIRRQTLLMTSALTANMARGSTDGMKVLDEAAEAVGWKEDERGGDFDQFQRKVMTVLGGRYIPASTKVEREEALRSAEEQTERREGETALNYNRRVIEAAEMILPTKDNTFAKFKEMHGAGADTLLRTLNAAFNHAGGDAAANVVGLFDDRDVSKKTGRINFKLVDVESEDGRNFAKGQREYMVQEIQLGRITGFSDIVGKRKAKNSKGGDLTAFNFDASNEQAISDLKQILKPITAGTRLHPRLIAELESQLDENGNLEPEAAASSKDGWLQVFRELEKESRESAINFAGKVSKFAKALDDRRIDQLVAEYENPAVAARSRRGGRTDDPDTT